MNIDANAGVRGVAQSVIPVVDSADKVKPQVAPVEKSGDSTRAALDERALQEKLQEKLQQKREEKPTSQELAEAVKNIRSRLEVVSTRIGFAIHEETEDLVVEVTDRESGELIRQIPSEEVLELRARLDELVGIIFDKKA